MSITNSKPFFSTTIALGLSYLIGLRSTTQDISSGAAALANMGITGSQFLLDEPQQASPLHFPCRYSCQVLQASAEGSAKNEEFPAYLSQTPKKQAMILLDRNASNLIDELRWTGDYR